MIVTLSFSDVFKDYDEFKKFTDDFKLYENNDAVAENFNKSLFYNLYNKYMGVSLAYTSEDEFCAEFGIAYQNYFRLFLQKKKMIDKLYNLTDEDFVLISESIANYSNNPNYNTQDPWEELTFISNQNRGRAKMGKFTAYLNALRTMPDAQIDYMLGKFDYLWLDILPTETINIY